MAVNYVGSEADRILATQHKKYPYEVQAEGVVHPPSCISTPLPPSCLPDVCRPKRLIWPNLHYCDDSVVHGRQKGKCEYCVGWTSQTSGFPGLDDPRQVKAAVVRVRSRIKRPGRFGPAASFGAGSSQSCEQLRKGKHGYVSYRPKILRLCLVLSTKPVISVSIDRWAGRYGV